MYRLLALTLTLSAALSVQAFPLGQYKLEKSQGPISSQCADAQLLVRRYEQNNMLELGPSILFTNINAGKIVEKDGDCTIRSITTWNKEHTKLEQSTSYEKQCEGGSSSNYKSLEEKDARLVYVFVQKKLKEVHKSSCIFKQVGEQ